MSTDKTRLAYAALYDLVDDQERPDLRPVVTWLVLGSHLGGRVLQAPLPDPRALGIAALAVLTEKRDLSVFTDLLWWAPKYAWHAVAIQTLVDADGSQAKAAAGGAKSLRGTQEMQKGETAVQPLSLLAIMPILSKLADGPRPLSAEDAETLGGGAPWASLTSRAHFALTNHGRGAVWLHQELSGGRRESGDVVRRMMECRGVGKVWAQKIIEALEVSVTYEGDSCYLSLASPAVSSPSSPAPPTSGSPAAADLLARFAKRWAERNAA